MFTKISFENNEIKKVFKSILKEEKFLYIIINYIEDEYKKMIIKDIKINNEELNIYLLCDNSDVLIKVDFIKDYTSVSNQNIPYELIFANHITEMGIPIGKLYKSEDRKLLNKSANYLNTVYSKMKMYELSVANKTYGIIINEYEEKFNERLIINKLLDTKIDINSINDIISVINEVININDFEIKINLLGENPDVLIMDHGVLTKYIFHKESDEYKEKIYLKNNEFYKEKTIREKINEEIPLIKKIGGRK